MSSAIMPSLAGLAMDVNRDPVWDTIVQTNISGREVRLPQQQYPRWRWDLQFNFLRTAAAFTEFQQLVGFFNARQGQADTFLYQDADDNAVTGQTIANGDGATTVFQLIRALGGFIEPVLAPNNVSAVYLNAVSIPSAGYSAATNGALTQTSSGALGAATYYVRSTWVTNSGETATSVESSLAVSANHVLNVAAPSSPPAGAIGWNVYVSTSTATETRQNGGTPIALGTPWVEPNTGLVAGLGFPLTNTTGWSFTQWGSASPGILTFAGNVANGIAITADFTYYWPVRMETDNLQFNRFIPGFYGVKKYSFISCKN